MNTAVLTIRSLFLRNERLSAFSIGAVLVMAVAAMGIVSLTSLNGNAMKGYQLNRLEEERQNLVTDGEITDMLTLRARSMSEIEQTAIVQSMRKPDRSEITYVLPVTVVAQK